MQLIPVTPVVAAIFILVQACLVEGEIAKALEAGDDLPVLQDTGKRLDSIASELFKKDRDMAPYRGSHFDSIASAIIRKRGFDAIASDLFKKKRPFDAIASDLMKRGHFDSIASDIFKRGNSFDSIASDLFRKRDPAAAADFLKKRPFGAPVPRRFSRFGPSEDHFDTIASDIIGKRQFDSIASELFKKRQFDSIASDLFQKRQFDSIASELFKKRHFDSIASELFKKRHFDSIASDLLRKRAAEGGPGEGELQGEGEVPASRQQREAVGGLDPKGEESQLATLTNGAREATPNIRKKRSLWRSQRALWRFDVPRHSTFPATDGLRHYLDAIASDLIRKRATRGQNSRSRRPFDAIASELF